MLYGRGAGGAPTASAVLGDVVAAAKVAAGGRADALLPSAPASMVPAGDQVGRWYCRIAVVDEPGVLAQIAGVFGSYGVSIATFVQKGRHEAPVDLVFITHDCRAGDFDAALEQVKQLPVVDSIAVRLGLWGEL